MYHRCCFIYSTEQQQGQAYLFGKILPCVHKQDPSEAVRALSSQFYLFRSRFPMDETQLASLAGRDP
jgi:hypothetical protein